MNSWASVPAAEFLLNWYYYGHTNTDLDLADISPEIATKLEGVKGVEVAPRDVLAAITPDPMTLGDKFRGRAVVGTWVLGTKDGRPRDALAALSAAFRSAVRG